MATAVADLIAHAVARPAADAAPGDLLARLWPGATATRTVDHADRFGPLSQQAGVEQPEAVIAPGWDECLAGLERLGPGQEQAATDAAARQQAAIRPSAISRTPLVFPCTRLSSRPHGASPAARDRTGPHPQLASAQGLTRAQSAPDRVATGPDPVATG
jgi:hypothetical protein